MKFPCENLCFLFGSFAFPKQADFFALLSAPLLERSDGAESFSFLILLCCYQLGSLKQKRRENEKGKGKEQGKEKRIICANHILQ